MQVIDYIKQAFDLKSKECYKQAVEMLYKALEIESDNIEILALLGELYYLMGNDERAEQYLVRVLDKNPEHVEGLKILREMSVKQKDYPKACEYAQTLREIQNTAQNLSELVKILSAAGKTAQIEEISDTDDPEVLYECAKAFYNSGNPDRALKMSEDAASSDKLRALTGKIYFDKGEFEKSREIFGGINEETPEILNYKGFFALEDMCFIDAIKFFSKAAAADRQNSVYHYNLGNAYFYNGWIEEAEQAYLKAVCMAPDNTDYRYSLAYLYFESKQFDKTRNELDLILSGCPEHTPARVLNALLKFENKDFLGAQKDLEKINSDDDFTLTSLAKVHRELGMFERALGIMRKIIEKNPQNFNYKYSLAEIHIGEKQYDKALEIADEIISGNENFIEAYILGAGAAFAAGDLEKTKFYAQNAISLDMNYPEGYYYLALVRSAEKDYDEAVECMKRAIMGDAGNAKYYAAMSEIYKDSGDIRTALDYINEAVNIDNCAEYKILYSELAALNRKNKSR